jgi:DNA-directed RNA polymerase subunit RPC12/RpoP
LRKGREGAWDLLSKAVLLREGEYFIDAWAANFMQVQSDPTSQYDSGYQTEHATGLLALTNKRLLFVAPRDEALWNPLVSPEPMDPVFLKASQGCNRDVSQERYCIWESLDLEDIESFKVKKGRLIENVALNVRWWHRGHPHLINFPYLLDLRSFDEGYSWTPGSTRSVDAIPVDRNALKGILTEALRDRWVEVGETLSRKKEPMVVDFSALREILSSQGVSLKSIKCPSCGGVIALPMAGAKKTCEYCGSHIYAMQVMPKAK